MKRRRLESGPRQRARRVIALTASSYVRGFVLQAVELDKFVGVQRVEKVLVQLSGSAEIVQTNLTAIQVGAGAQLVDIAAATGPRCGNHQVSVLDKLAYIGQIALESSDITTLITAARGVHLHRGGSIESGRRERVLVRRDAYLRRRVQHARCFAKRLASGLQRLPCKLTVIHHCSFR